MPKRLTLFDLLEEDTLDDFYPTPYYLAEKVLGDVNWDKIEHILEPSAGNGALVKAVMKKLKRHRYHTDWWKVDCIEIDPNLQAILKASEYKVIHDDFLTFHTFMRYDLIVMNPPFSRGAEHLHKALDLIQDGGSLICILNAETIRNPYNNIRRHLVTRLEEYNAQIEYIENAFMNAERKSNVTIAVVKCTVEAPVHTSFIWENLKQSDEQEEDVGEPQALEKKELYEKHIDRYNFEARAGIQLIKEHRALSPYILDGYSEYARPILSLKIDNHDANRGKYLQSLRKKYWYALFMSGEFLDNLPSKMREELYGSVNTLGDYDFSLFNILQLRCDLMDQLNAGIDKTIISLFDDWTHKYSWYDSSKNIHYYNGWKTNNAFKVAKKVIIPFNNGVWCRHSGRFNPTSYEVPRYLSDIEKVFDYLSGVPANPTMIHHILKVAESKGQTKKISFRYYNVTFFKKGTAHIDFTDDEAVYRFNLYAARNKQWLPPTYGKKRYRDMTKEEKDVIDSFEGEERYEKTRSAPDVYLLNSRLLIGDGMEIDPDDDNIVA